MNGELINEKSQENHHFSKHSKDNMVVSLLDDTEYTFDVEPKSKGEELLQKVNSHLNLEESEFFGLLYVGRSEIQYWLDPKKSIVKQLKDADATKFIFRVMYYTPDPNSLQEYTKYLYTLQIRRDLLDGRLVCSEDTGALLASYIVQGELGDYDPLKHADGYLKGFNFVPKQTPEIEQKIVAYHKSHRGRSPAESDHEMLDIARQLDMYGITLYPATDADGQSVDLAMYHMGVTVFKNAERINNFLWTNLRKLSFKKRKILLKLRSQSGKDTTNVITYSLESRKCAKNFWKICVNHHVFFRAQSALHIKKNSSFKKGSKYRYSGRTRKEIEIADKQRRTSANDNGNFYSNNLSAGAPNVTMSNASSNSKPRSEDEGAYSIQSDDNSSSLKESQRVEDLAEDNYIPMTNTSQQQTIVKLQHQDSGVSEDVHASYPEAESDLFSEKLFAKIPLMDKLRLTDGDDDSLDARLNVTSTDQEIEDEDFSRLDTFKTHDFSFEVASMFQKINSEYGGSQSGWQYNITSVTSSEHEDEVKEEGSETEDNIKDSSEFTEVDANQVMVDYNDNQQKHSDKTEADEETEMQLKQKVIELYMPQKNPMPSYDSDSDASAMTVDEEESAFEDDSSLPRSSTSSVSSVHVREGYLQQMRKLKSSGDIYNIAKEMLLTERTLVKDLEVLTVSFRNVVEKDKILSDHLMKLLYDNLDPLYDYHCSLLAELEERLSLWETVSPTEATQDNIQKIGDIMHRNMRQMKLNVQYIKQHETILLALEAEAKSSKKFENIYKEFELGTVCYLSLNSFLLKPVQRLLYYRNMLERLTNDYGNQHPDAIDAKVAFEEVAEACKEVQECRESLGNLHKLVELERDLVGLEDLLHPQRKFVREGCLHKICRKGPQPRMFFLLSDMLLYTSQGVTATNQFRARAAVPLRSMKLEDGGVELHSLYAFTITGGDGKSFIVAANSPEEKAKWMTDLQNCITKAVKDSFCEVCEANKTEFILNVGGNNNYMCPACKGEVTKLANMSPDDRLLYWRKHFPPPVTINHRNSNEADSEDEGSYSMTEQFTTLDRRHAHSRTISTRKVCWHRNASISMKEYTLSIQNSFSGNLRRKYKNTNRWQKMWVVFTNFCLYFFKNYEEDSPFASLPLIGYAISRPSESEVHDEFAIKLTYKTHTYIFKADKEYAFKRWMEVLTIATKSSTKQTRLKSRMAGRLASSS